MLTNMSNPAQQVRRKAQIPEESGSAGDRQIIKGRVPKLKSAKVWSLTILR